MTSVHWTDRIVIRLETLNCFPQNQVEFRDWLHDYDFIEGWASAKTLLMCWRPATPCWRRGGRWWGPPSTTGSSKTIPRLVGYVVRESFYRRLFQATRNDCMSKTKLISWGANLEHFSELFKFFWIFGMSVNISTKNKWKSCFFSVITSNFPNFHDYFSKCLVYLLYFWPLFVFGVFLKKGENRVPRFFFSIYARKNCSGEVDVPSIRGWKAAPSTRTLRSLLFLGFFKPMLNCLELILINTLSLIVYTLQSLRHS